MATYDLNEIQSKMSLSLDQSGTPPTAGSNEYALRTGFINRALNEWAGAYDWESLRTSAWLNVTGVSQASIALPTDFRKTAGFPLYYSGGVSGGEQWPEIQPNETKLYSESSKYFFTLGSRGSNTLVWSPGTLASGASLYFEYFKYPASLASPADVSNIGDVEYLVDRSIAYVFEARNDARFQQIEAKAREKLLNLIENENSKPKSYENTLTTPERRMGFRMGRD